MPRFANQPTSRFPGIPSCSRILQIRRIFHGVATARMVPSLIGNPPMANESLHADPSSLLERAQLGDEQALGDLLQAYRPYLSLLARLKTDRMLQSKLSDSDLVQETSLAALRDFTRFRGATEPELTVWLREIMAHVAANVVRNYRRQRRDVHLERQCVGSFESILANLGARTCGSKTVTESINHPSRTCRVAGQRTPPLADRLSRGARDA